jgi:aspartate kinase
VLPAIERNIPVRILNSRRPQVEGTLIVSKSVSTSNVAKAISTKRNVIVLNIHSTRMLMAHGFLRRIFEVFDRFETPVDMVSTSEVSVSLTIDNPRHLDEIVSELEQFADVYVERDHAILCVVGDNIRHTPGIAGAVFDSLGEINVRMISQGASRLNISFVINNGDVPLAVERLHRRFFSQLDPAVFD